ncbi:hypothetical protein [Meiothermus rufus]|uniref:hypothetical protein n=1 Tax=Meiothermus rufus TaxID=604332 RepID=UPI0004820B83|nr:hypothetical protein [Meiothermus rufus]
MRSLRLRVKDFLAQPLPSEIALHHNPDSLTEMVLSSYASGQPFDAGLIRMAQLCLGEIDQAMGQLESPEARNHILECRKLLVEILQEVV